MLSFVDVMKKLQHEEDVTNVKLCYRSKSTKRTRQLVLGDCKRFRMATSTPVSYREPKTPPSAPSRDAPR